VTAARRRRAGGARAELLGLLAGRRPRLSDMVRSTRRQRRPSPPAGRKVMMRRLVTLRGGPCPPGRRTPTARENGMIPTFLFIANSFSRFSASRFSWSSDRILPYIHPAARFATTDCFFRTRLSAPPTNDLKALCASTDMPATDTSSSDVAAIVWFRKDLRIHDHEPLWRASQGRHEVRIPDLRILARKFRHKHNTPMEPLINVQFNLPA
jgi:hypothetical protein